MVQLKRLRQSFRTHVTNGIATYVEHFNVMQTTFPVSYKVKQSKNNPLKKQSPPITTPIATTTSITYECCWPIQWPPLQ